MKGFMYWHPKLYRATMKVLYGKEMYDKRYEYMVKEVKDMQVLDIGCADCHLAERLPKDKYTGIDINEKFIKAARKKGINVKLLDVLKHNLPHAECIMISGILHQLYPYHELLIKKALDAASKRVVICEPTSHIASSKNHFIAKIARMINDPGYGSPKKRLNKKELFALYGKYNFKKIYEVGRDSFAIFDISGKRIKNPRPKGRGIFLSLKIGSQSA